MPILSRLSDGRQAEGLSLVSLQPCAPYRQLEPEALGREPYVEGRPLQQRTDESQGNPSRCMRQAQRRWRRLRDEATLTVLSAVRFQCNTVEVIGN